MKQKTGNNTDCMCKATTLFLQKLKETSSATENNTFVVALVGPPHLHNKTLPAESHNTNQ